MNRLYDEKKVTITTCSYKINSLGSGADSGSCGLGGVNIIFKNGKFKEATFPFCGRYTQVQWEVLGAINEKIKEIAGEK